VRNPPISTRRVFARSKGTLSDSRGSLFHKTNSSALFHPVESVDKLISIEDRDESVHCTGSVLRAWDYIFSEDASGILHSLQYRVLIRGVHGTHLTERGLNYVALQSFLQTAQRFLHRDSLAAINTSHRGQ